MRDGYTRPELSTERVAARRLRIKVTAAGGCAFCMHRVEGWGRSTCSSMTRVFPLCVSQAGISFEPDYKKLNEVTP